MRIVFVTNYLYLNLPVFEPIIAKLTEKGINSCILYLPGNVNISIEKRFDLDYFKNKRIDFVKVPILRFSPFRRNFFSRLQLLRVLFKNWKIIRNSLEKLAPDLVIAGSDLGNIYVRFLMNFCYLLRIPVVIIYSCDLPESNTRSRFHFLYLWRNKILFSSKILSFLRACLFTGTIPGEYALDSTICVVSEEIRQRLIEKGINKDRIVVTGIPFINSLTTHSPEDTYEELNISKNYKKIVVLFTECIQNIYGIKYTEKLYIELLKTFKDLSEDIFFIIKLHPLEDEEMKNFIKNIFNNEPRVKIAANLTPERLIQISELCIAHFSRTLIISALMKKRILSINLINDRKNTFLSEREAKILEINSFKDLKRKIKKALEDSEFKEKIDKMLVSIANRFFSANSCEKIISIILNKVQYPGIRR